MRVKIEQDLLIGEKAISTFVDLFNGSYQALGPHDVDYKVFDSNNELLAYVDVKSVQKPSNTSFPLIVSASRLISLSNKRLNPVFIWACIDGIVYSKVSKLNGNLKWMSQETDELFVTFENSSNFKIVPYV